MNKLIKNIVKEVAVDLSQEFDKNFERKGFFDKKWPEARPNHRGSLMRRSGALRRSIVKEFGKGQIIWHSNLPYASIHNEGGEIEVTAKMKKFFWAMYYKAAGAITYSIRTKAMAKTKRNYRLSAEADKWKAMALMKEGSKLKIEQRQFIGWHPRVDASIAEIVATNMKKYESDLFEKLKQK